jgi:hypothetical protein
MKTRTGTNMIIEWNTLMDGLLWTALKKTNRGKIAKLNNIYKQPYLLLSRLNIEFELI